MSEKNYDIIIIGAGCAGMQLMKAFLHHPLYRNQRMLLLDDGKSIRQQKSWCFWYRPHFHPYQHLISKQWEHLSIGSKGGVQTKKISPYVYAYIDSNDFFDYHLQLIHDNPQVDYREEQVLYTAKNTTGFYVNTSKGAYYSRYVFSSSWNQKTIVEQASVYLQQQFYGWVIETDNAVFNDNAATLMDFRVDQLQGVSFTYVLPFSPHSALVEFTSFSDKPFDNLYFEDSLSNYIHTHFGSAFSIKKKEQAVIPMTDYCFNRFTSEGAVAIGTAAGMIKPTTGYAFNRIMRDSHHLAEQILKGKEITGFERSRFHFYDRLLLQLLQKNAQEAGDILQTLFNKISYPLTLKFLDEDTSVWQEAFIFSKLPKKSFIQTIPELWKQPRFRNIPATQA